MITLTFSCGGCDKVVPGVLRPGIAVSGFAPDVKFEFMVARSSTRIQDHAPEGWIAFDPYTQCTYCPDCWAGIEQEQPE